MIPGPNPVSRLCTNVVILQPALPLTLAKLTFSRGLVVSTGMVSAVYSELRCRVRGGGYLGNGGRVHGVQGAVVPGTGYRVRVLVVTAVLAFVTAVLAVVTAVLAFVTAVLAVLTTVPVNQPLARLINHGPVTPSLWYHTGLGVLELQTDRGNAVVAVINPWLSN